MKNKAEDITRYIFQATDILFLDANVWYLVFGPSDPSDWRVSIYSGALAKMQTAQSRIYIDALVLSEFINRYARLKYNLSPLKSTVDFKQFRQSAEFKSVAQDIAADVRRILRYCTRIESGFSTLDINALVDEYEEGNSDFNDQVVAELCKSKSLKLVTHDRDFKDRGLMVVTANRALLI